jgi:hypothetical protein
MKTIYALTTTILIAFIAANDAAGKEWRGIVPLQSTRADVERLLGPPKQQNTFAYYYSFPTEIAVIWFQSGPCDQFGIGWNVPTGTVTSIGVIPKGSLRKEKLLGGNKFEAQDANAGFFYYTDESEGFSVDTLKGIVTSLEFAPPKTADDQRCPRLQLCCLDPFPKFDEYRDLTFSDEKARLDNYAIYMTERISRGVIVVYGESREKRNKTMKRAERAKWYLNKKDGIEAQRVLVVDGGYREDSAIELNLLTIGGNVSRIYLFPQKDR